MLEQKIDIDPKSIVEKVLVRIPNKNLKESIRILIRMMFYRIVELDWRLKTCLGSL